MKSDLKHIIDDFGALPDHEKREVLAELIRMSQHIEYPSISDEELLSAANDVFLGYDQRESDE